MITGTDILNSHLGFRTRNQWVEKSKFIIRPGNKDAGSYQIDTLSNVLNSPGLAGLKFRYFKTKGVQTYMEKYLNLPFTMLVNYANTLMRPLYTDFTEVTEHEEFAAISGKFYAQLFIQEYLFVTYNVFEEGKTEFILKDDSDTRNKEIMEMIKEKGGFDLWVKLDENEYSKNVEFMHLDTSLTVKFPKGRTQLAGCKGGAMGQGNLDNGMHIAGMELLHQDFLDKCIRQTGKKITLTTQGNNDDQKDKLNEQLNSFDTYLHFNLKNTADLEPLESLTGEDLLAIKDTIYYHQDRIKFEYGRVANTNPKGERITSGENYKDISAIANRQKETLEYLIYFAMQVKKLWGIQLEFAISGIPEKEAVYSVAHGAQTPNMEKEMFGQIEGTNPRPPIGQKGIRKANKTGSWSN